VSQNERYHKLIRSQAAAPQLPGLALFLLLFFIVGTVVWVLMATFVSSLQRVAAAEAFKNLLSRDRRGCSIFGFFNTIGAKRTGREFWRYCRPRQS
jgi:hypothetical protein